MFYYMFLLFFLGVLCYFSWKNWIKICVDPFGANLCPFRCFLGVSHAMFIPILCHVSLVLNARFVWYFAILLNWTFDTNPAIPFFVKFGSWLLLCDISICLLKLILDYYFVIIPFFLLNLILDTNFVIFCNYVKFDSWY